ncbi:hypothetical protein Tco_0771966 [Tanacetum coccineum]|uniref:Synaptobrevin, longin-like domain protein n=1 Tax=Tanacetum coccineum TaxID=301880 RepID=A0ABQ4ZHI2_9ASTR
MGISVNSRPIEIKIEDFLSGVVRTMMSPGGSIMASRKDINGFLAVKHVEYLMLNASPFEVMFEKEDNGVGEQNGKGCTTASTIEAEQYQWLKLVLPVFVSAIKRMLMLSVQVSTVEGDSINTSIKVNGVRQLQALVDKKRFIVTESSIRRDLYLDDAEGTDCLPTATIFEELARMRYEKPSQKLTFYKAFFSPQWKYFIHTITQCLSAKSTAWNEFSSSMASLIICLATNQKFNLSKYIFDAMVKHLDGGVKFLMYLLQPVEEMDEDSDHLTDSTPIHIIDQPSSSSQPKKKQPSKKAQRQEAEHEESVLTPSNDLQPSEVIEVENTQNNAIGKADPCSNSGSNEIVGDEGSNSTLDPGLCSKRLQKLVSRLAILGVVTPLEDLNKVKRSAGANNDDKNLAFLTTSGASSTNNINTVNLKLVLKGKHHDIDNGNWNQGSSSKACKEMKMLLKGKCAIDGAGFDWSDMVEEEIQANMAHMAFSIF